MDGLGCSRRLLELFLHETVRGLVSLMRTVADCAMEDPPDQPIIE
jgi:hypothetical protein